MPMRSGILSILLLLLAVPALLAQQQLAGKVLDLTSRVIDLTMRVTDLNGALIDFGGKVEDMQIRETSDEGRPIVATEPDSPHAQIYKTIAATIWAALSGGGATRAAPRIVIE